MGCMAAKPIVDGIEREHGERLRVIRVNVQDTAGQALADRYRFEFTPTFVLFDAGGRELLRTVGAVDPAAVRRALASP
jgi:thiol-disulfide isomerase/thioredoxin